MSQTHEQSGIWDDDLDEGCSHNYFDLNLFAHIREQIETEREEKE